MRKINRRDYLLQMGAGAVGVMGSAPLDILAGSQGPTAQGQTSARPTALLWKPTDVFPSNARVTVIFGGLCGFFYNSGDCEVGAHKGDGRHRLMIAVWERKNGGGCNLLYSMENGKLAKPKLGTLPKPKGELKIEIVGRSVSDVNCYQVGSYDRKNLRERDFRWLPDLDSDDFYPENYSKLRGQFKLKSIVRHGTFYTYQRTNSTFTLVDPPEPNSPNEPVNHTDFYHVAEYMAAGIQPNANERVSLQIDNNPPILLEDKAGFTFEITILNHCYENEHSHETCKFKPNDPNEINRNDFHFMRTMLQLPPRQKRYGLKLKDGKPSSKPGFCFGIQKETTDEAPCMGGAFGKTNGMP